MMHVPWAASRVSYNCIATAFILWSSSVSGTGKKLHANRLSNLCRMEIRNYTNENVLQIDTSATVNEFVIAIGMGDCDSNVQRQGMWVCLTFFDATYGPSDGGRTRYCSQSRYTHSLRRGNFPIRKLVSNADSPAKCPVDARVCVFLQINNLLNCHAVNEYMP